MEDEKLILEQFDRSIKDRFGTALVSIVVSSGVSVFLSIWKKPLLDPNDVNLSSMRYLPLFYVICSLNEKSRLTLKLITHHGKIVDSLIEAAEDDDEKFIKFVEKLTTLKMCQGIKKWKKRDLKTIPHLVEQLEQNVITRSRQCKFALFQGVVCDSCQKLHEYKNIKLKWTQFKIRSGLTKDAQNKEREKQRRMREAKRNARNKVTLSPSDNGNLCTGLPTDHTDGAPDDQSSSVELELTDGVRRNTDNGHYIVNNDCIEVPENVLAPELRWVECENDGIRDFDDDNLFGVSTGDNDGIDNECDQGTEEDTNFLEQRKNSRYNCDKCFYHCSNRSQLNKHISLLHQVDVSSNDEDIIATQNNLLSNKEKVKQYCCERCTFKTITKSKLDDHISTVHNQLSRRIRRIRPKICPELLNCQLCEHMSSTKSELNKHIRQQHPQPTKKFRCSNCSFVTSRRAGVTEHINAVHCKVKPYMCQHCSRTFSSNGNLTQHIHAVHDKLKPFICQYCTYANSSEPNLRKHIKAVHHKIRDFKCDICPFAAASKQLLVRHVNAVHEKIKDYKCKYCQYECAKGYNMKIHIRHVHEKTKGYKCDHCAFEATRKGKLNEHVIACHGGVNNTDERVSKFCHETIKVQSTIETHSLSVE